MLQSSDVSRPGCLLFNNSLRGGRMTRGATCGGGSTQLLRKSSQLHGMRKGGLRVRAVASPTDIVPPSLASPTPQEQSSTPLAVPDMWGHLAERHGDLLAMSDPHHTPAETYTYRQAAEAITHFASGLQSLGLRRGDCVSLFSENSSRWLIADQGIMKAGGIDAVRGVSSTLEELHYIMQHTASSGLVVQDAATLDKLLPLLVPGGEQAEGSAAPLSGTLRFVALLWGEPSADAKQRLACPALAFGEVLERGRAAAGAFQAPRVGADDVATYIFTSGTTGNPKAVALSHANLLYQLQNFNFFIGVNPGDKTLSLLPCWHVYERTVGYYLYSCGAHQVYSNVRRFREDLTAYPPDFFVCVPLVLDSLHSKVMSTLKKGSALRRGLALGLLAAAGTYVRAKRVMEGVALQYARQPRPLLALVQAWITKQLLAPLYWLAQKLVVSKVRAALGIRKCVVSGGGSLMPHLDDFYESIGLPVLNGWGLTETSPVLACRRNAPGLNVRGSVGQPIPGTQLRFVDPETLQDVPDGQQGLILARGPGVMQGYHANEAATAKAFVGDGWFDTGDLGWRAPQGVAGSSMAGTVVITGRAKDTIVLSSGENVEPAALEDLAQASPYIKFCVLLGSGHRALGALVVPDGDVLAEEAAARGVEALADGEVHKLVRAELDKVTEGRVRWERIAAFEVLKDPFSVEGGTLTRTMKPRRPAIMAKYASQVAALEKRLR